MAKAFIYFALKLNMCLFEEKKAIRKLCVNDDAMQNAVSKWIV